MRKLNFTSILVFVAILYATTIPAIAQTRVGHPAPDVDGNVWMSSTDQEKNAFLFGAGSAVVLEYHIRDKHSEEPSRFVKGWVDGLKDMSWTQLTHAVDQFYKSNPGKMNKHVFEVIWQEIIKPNLNK